MKRTAGFTIIEITIVLIIAGLLMALMGLSFGRYMERSSAKRAAEIFGQDLTVARNTASRSRQRVVLDFDEGTLGYVIRVEAGDTLVTRFFDDSSDLRLSSLDLELSPILPGLMRSVRSIFKKPFSTGL